MPVVRIASVSCVPSIAACGAGADDNAEPGDRVGVVRIDPIELIRAA